MDLGTLYLNHASDLGADRKQGYVWIEKAADQGDINAMMQMARARVNDKSLPDRVEQGMKWYRKAAAAGDTNAMLALGGIYRYGKSVPGDGALAMEWYYKAAVADGYGLSEIGDMYARGQGVPKDDAQALKWYRRGVETGDPAAMRELGNRYQAGDGVAKDPAEALRLFNLSADIGDTESEQILIELGVERMPKSLERRVPEFKFANNDLSDCIDFLRDVTGADLYVDWHSPGRSGRQKEYAGDVGPEGYAVQRSFG